MIELPSNGKVPPRGTSLDSRGDPPPVAFKSSPHALESSSLSPSSSPSSSLDEGPEQPLAPLNPLLGYWLVFALWVHAGVEGFFYRLGRLCARRPRLVIGTMIFAAAVFISGLITHFEERADFDLWVPTDSPSLVTDRRFKKLWPGDDSMGSFNLLVKAKGGASILEPATLKAAMGLYENVNAFRAKGLGPGGGDIGLLDVCSRPSPAYDHLCAISTGLMVYKNRAEQARCLNSTYQCSYLLDATLVSSAEDALQRAINADGTYTNFFAGAAGPLRFDAQWGALTYAHGSDSVVSDVGGVSMSWTVDGARLARGPSDMERLAIAFEGFMTEESGAHDGLDISFLAPSSISREFFNASLNSGATFAAGLMMMLIFATLTLGKCGSLSGRKGVAVCGIIDTLLATASGFGVCMWLGFFYTPFSQIVPFLALGLGVDDM